MNWKDNEDIKPYFTPKQLADLENEIRKIKEDCYYVSEVSDDMKKLVNTIYGADDYSLSGYWVRAERIILEGAR